MEVVIVNFFSSRYKTNNLKMPFVSAIVRTNQRSPHFENEFWDQPEGTCLRCQTTLNSENDIHLCRKIANIYLEPCECNLNWDNRTLEFFNLSKEPNRQRCKRCKTLDIPIEMWNPPAQYWG